MTLPLRLRYTTVGMAVPLGVPLRCAVLVCVPFGQHSVDTTTYRYRSAFGCAVSIGRFGAPFWCAVLVCRFDVALWWAVLVYPFGLPFWCVVFMCRFGVPFGCAVTVCRFGVPIWCTVWVCLPGISRWRPNLTTQLNHLAAVFQTGDVIRDQSTG